ncbi:WecB/TagA/CpsF family glycosyltransferase [Paenibacillus sp. J2TS4]|uniref:WecB/TagA/CpsF family glycosyltransferase n=1 Tax=Paenibacillus sp. J2TS4 TaxID=2807194 RepID=UPI001B2AF85C|nr:WecB/TagA/CpsF family glycosyltransferase [Paenibacillus sp. J2TS4]GIP36545.1 acetylglucosaminyldiphosphoundecaprenol acetyl-beta-D-mannosaminyltransferase [Paenibacillus sp. J2TS4]
MKDVNDVVRIMGVPVAKLSMDQTVQWLTERLKTGGTELCHVVTANPEMVMNQQHDQELKQIIHEAELVTPDGIGMVMAAKWKGEPVPERVTGYDLLLRLLEAGGQHGWSFYFLGTDEETNRKAVEIIRNRYPGVQIAGSHHGFFAPEEEDRLVTEIRKAQPDFLIVALGIPRAEKWIHHYKNQLGAKVAIGVGGSLDVIAGKVKGAPEIWKRLNLEWLYRLLRQPSRWRRQLVLPKFAVKAYLTRNE